MIQQVYDFIIQLVDFALAPALAILPVLQTASDWFDGTSYSGFMDLFLDVMPTMATYSVFWFDQSLFPDYFGVALGVYISCVVVSMALKIIRAILFFV